MTWSWGEPVGATVVALDAAVEPAVAPVLTVVVTGFVVLVDVLLLLHDAMVSNRPAAAALRIKIFMVFLPRPVWIVPTDRANVASMSHRSA